MLRQMRVLVVHGSDVLARGFLSVAPDLWRPDGRLANALFGAVRTVRQALALKEPELAVAVVESEPPAHWPSALHEQAPDLPGLLAVHGLPVVHTPDARHVVASYVQAALNAGHDVVVVGSDKRLAQLVSDRVWWYEGHKDVRYTPESIRKKFGVGPETVAGFLGLVGERDLLPGVTGIGKKGAIGLIEVHGSATEAIAAAEQALSAGEPASGRAAKALHAALDDAEVQVRAATLDRHRPLPTPLSELTYAPPTLDALNGCYRDLGFFSLLSAGGQPDTVDISIALTEAEVAAALAEAQAPTALQALWDAPSPARGSLVGLAIALGVGRAVYVPLHDNTHLVPHAALAKWLSDPDHPKVGHDSKAATVVLARRGVSVRGIVGDSAIASHLADPSGSAPHDLHALARTRLHRPVPDPDSVLGTGTRRVTWASRSADIAGAYAGALVVAAADLWQQLAPGTCPDLLAEALALSDTLVRMELAGMPCDRDDLAASGADFERINDALQAEVEALAGHPFSINSTKQLGTVLFEELGLPVLHKTKTGWSTANHVLQRLMCAHPIVPLVYRWRQLRRLRDSWVTALTRAIDTDGRVRSTFHPSRSFSGRLVNSHPDLGRVPGRTPELARIRHAFRARPGWTLLSVDYEQLGLYVLAHLTQDPALVRPLSRGDDMHTATAAAVLELDPAEVDADARQLGKVVNFATFAGQGASSLALQLGMSAAQAKVLIARFFDRYAVTRRFLDDNLAHAQAHGWVPTLAGRRWPIADLTSHEQRDRAYAERLARRASHEASVADVTRRGLLHADQALRTAGSDAFPLVQIHDEVLFEVPEPELAAVIELTSDAMRGAYDLVVPLKVGCKAGPSWAELTPL